MLIKAVTIFLVGMAVLGMFGKLRVPKVPRIGRARRCSDCGAVKPGSGACPCGGGKA